MIQVPAHTPTGYAEEVYASLCSNSYLFAAPPVIHWAERGGKISTYCITKVTKNDGHVNYLDHVTAVLQLDLLDDLSVIKSNDRPREELPLFSEEGDEEEIPYFSSSEEQTGFGLYIDRLQSIPTSNGPFTRVWIAARLPGGYQPIGIDTVRSTTSDLPPLGQCADAATSGSPMVLSLLSLERVPGADGSNTATLRTAHLFRMTSAQLASAYLSWQPAALRVELIDAVRAVQDDAAPLCTSSSRAANVANLPRGNATPCHDINTIRAANAPCQVHVSHEDEDELVLPSLAAALGAVCPHTIRLRQERMSRLLGSYGCDTAAADEAAPNGASDPR